MGKVRVECLSWLTETLSIGGAGNEVTFEHELEGERTTVRGLLNRLVARYPRFGQIVFDAKAQKLTGSVSIFFNGRLLESVDGLETKLNDDDTLTFVPIIEGG